MIYSKHNTCPSYFIINPTFMLMPMLLQNKAQIGNRTGHCSCMCESGEVTAINYSVTSTELCKGCEQPI